MSKEKEKAKEVAAPVATPAVAPTLPDVGPEKMSEMDRMALELAKSRKQTAQATANTSAAQLETADIAYKYVILQLYRKYNLSEQDAISEDGSLLRGGAVQAQ